MNSILIISLSLIIFSLIFITSASWNNAASNILNDYIDSNITLVLSSIALTLLTAIFINWFFKKYIIKNISINK